MVTLRGAAMEVPVRVSVASLLELVMDTMSVPGAKLFCL